MGGSTQPPACQSSRPQTRPRPTASCISRCESPDGLLVRLSALPPRKTATQGDSVRPFFRLGCFEGGPHGPMLCPTADRKPTPVPGTGSPQTPAPSSSARPGPRRRPAPQRSRPQSGRPWSSAAKLTGTPREEVTRPISPRLVLRSGVVWAKNVLDTDRLSK